MNGRLDALHHHRDCYRVDGNHLIINPTSTVDNSLITSRSIGILKYAIEYRFKTERLQIAAGRVANCTDVITTLPYILQPI